MNNGSIVNLEDDGRAETMAMMDKHFDPGYQKVRTITGDLYFERGQYSRESGYWDTVAIVVTGATLQTVASATIGPNDMGCAEIAPPADRGCTTLLHSDGVRYTSPPT
jgi:hypothetical protein